MIQLEETYTWQQLAVMSKLDKLQAELDIICFSVSGNMEDIYKISEYAAVEAMRCFSKRQEEHFQKNKEMYKQKFPKFDFNRIFRIKINEGIKPVGEKVPFDKFVGFDYENEEIDIHQHGALDLVHALLEPPYSLRLPIEVEQEDAGYYKLKMAEYTKIYRLFIKDFLLLSEQAKDKVTIYRWSDEWSNYFDAGKEWWGTFYWTIYNSETNTIIVIGASATD
jgi:hypothetical protein